MTTFRKARGIHPFRSVAAAVLCTAGIVLILLGSLVAYGTRTLLDSNAFAERAARSLDDQRVASYVAGAVTHALIQQERDLISVRPVILAATEAVVSTTPFRAAVQRGVRESHKLVMTQGGRGVLFSVSDLGIILRGTLAAHPGLAEVIPNEAAVIASLNETRLLEDTGRLLRRGQRLRADATLAFFAGVLLLCAGVLVSADRRSTLLCSGLGLIAGAALIFFLAQFGGTAVAKLVEEKSLGDALAGLWDAFAGGLRPRAIALAGIGLLMVSASTALLDQVQLDAFVRAFRAVFLRPTESRLARLGRALGLILVGGLTVAHPQVTGVLLVMLAGLVVCFLGLRELCHLAMPTIAELSAPELRNWGAVRVLGRVLALIVLVGVLAGAAILITRAPSAPAWVRTPSGCGGHPRLCDLRLDQVVFAGAHNAMSSADVPGWLFPNQEFGIRAQLRDGIRALLIDVYSGVPVGEHVKTDLEDGTIAREKFEPTLGPEGVEAALRIRDHLVGAEEVDRALFMCHGLCELGATPLVPTLREIREFLVLNPYEVLFIIIEDTVPPAEIETAFHESGLIDFVYRGGVTPPWPTLGEMIRSDERVLVFAEKNAAGVAWYHQAFEVFQETPYDFRTPEEFSCQPNRGGTEGSLLLVNHWISTPPSSRISDAEVANTYDVLMARARRCQRVRGRLPNIIAVDFYATGDVLEVVRTLNGLGARVAHAP